jgi:ribosomal protein S8
MAYAFAISYLNQYPSEKVGPSTFACDETIRNAQFATSLQALAIPVSDEQEEIFDLLNEQNFTLSLDFINTASSCLELSVVEVVQPSTISLSLLSCSDSNGTVSARVQLPQHGTTIMVTLSGIQLVGGVRLGLSGPGAEIGVNILQELDFLQPFYSQVAGTLAQNPTIAVTLTKVSLFDSYIFLLLGLDNFTDSWIPRFQMLT